MNLSCTGRRAFQSEDKARTVVYRMRAQGSDVHSFKCGLCGMYHIGKRVAVESPR